MSTSHDGSAAAGALRVVSGNGSVAGRWAAEACGGSTGLEPIGGRGASGRSTSGGPNGRGKISIEGGPEMGSDDGMGLEIGPLDGGDTEMTGEG